MPGRSIRPGDDVVELDVHLDDVHPPVWRRLQVPAAATLAELHAILQRAMGWTGSHLHEFQLGEHRWGVPDPDGPPVVDEAGVTLGALAAPGARLQYLYDYGDGWGHALSVRQIVAAEAGVRYPRCLDGARACPPENVGGPWGYQTLLEGSADPGFDSEAFDVATVERRLHRTGPKRAAAPPVVLAVSAPDPATGMVLRCTGKFLKVLKPKAPLLETPPSPEDWYANILYIQGRKCLLVTHAGTLFSVFIPDVRAAGLRPIGATVVPAVQSALVAESLPADAFGALEPDAVRLAKTADRSILASMNRLADYCEFVVARHGGLAEVELSELHRLLHRNPLGSREYKFAVDLVRARLGLEPTRREWV